MKNNKSLILAFAMVAGLMSTAARADMYSAGSTAGEVQPVTIGGHADAIDWGGGGASDKAEKTSNIVPDTTISGNTGGSGGGDTKVTDSKTDYIVDHARPTDAMAGKPDANAANSGVALVALVSAVREAPAISDSKVAPSVNVSFAAASVDTASFIRSDFTKDAAVQPAFASYATATVAVAAPVIAPDAIAAGAKVELSRIEPAPLKTDVVSANYASVAPSAAIVGAAVYAEAIQSKVVNTVAPQVLVASVDSKVNNLPNLFDNANIKENLQQQYQQLGDRKLEQQNFKDNVDKFQLVQLDQRSGLGK
jgi:hypothetical protein